MKKVVGFGYHKTNAVYMRRFKNGKWESGKLVKEDQFSISVMAPALHYGQQCFEGLKAYLRKDGKVNLFRISDNARRFQSSCERLLMPQLPVEDFIEGVKATVLENKDFLPPYGTEGTLYIRPLMIGVGPKLGLGAADEFLFIVIVSPVGAYIGDPKPIKVVTSEYDRAAPFGTGDVKVGGNYAGSVFALEIAKKEGFQDVLFLDPKTHTKIEEVGAANFYGITFDNKYLTPKSPSILNSITNRALKTLAEDKLGLEVIEGDIYIDKMDHIKEAAACGTALLITPIGSITHLGKTFTFTDHEKIGPYSQQLKELLTGIQFGSIADPYGWITTIN